MTNHKTMALVLLLGPAASVSAQVVFEPAKNYPVNLGSLFASATVGDVDNDGDVDVLVGGGAAGIQWLPNPGNGVLGAPQSINPDLSWEMRLADLDADGSLDLINADGSILARLGNGTGQFGPAIIVNTTPAHAIFSQEVADATGDGVLDVISMSGQLLNHPAQVDVVPGIGNGTFGTAMTIQGALGGFVPIDAEVGDLNGDGRPDIVVMMTSLADSSLRMFLGSATGTFALSGSIGFGGQRGSDFVLHDANQDGFLDILVGGVFGLAVMAGHGDGTFATAALATPVPVDQIALADYDGDGVKDVIYTNLNTWETLVFRGTPAGSFHKVLSITGTSSSTDASPADFDGDGRMDLGLLAVDINPTYRVFRNHTYTAQEPWKDLGASLASSEGLQVPAVPILFADGSLIAGQPFSISLARTGLKLPSAILVIGVSPLYGLFQGGTFVPAADILIGPFVTSSWPGGIFAINGIMPAGVPSGIPFWMQAWFLPGMEQTTFAATNAILGVTP